MADGKDPGGCRRRLLDPDNPFFRPLWRRVATVGVAAAWALVELAFGNQTWAFVFGGLAAYAGWVLLVDFKPGDGAKGGPDDGDGRR